VHDIKLENCQLISCYRESIGHKIFIFNPQNIKHKTHRYNPLEFHGIQDIEELYGESDASNIISDCSFKIFFGANDFKTPKHISYLCLDKKENKEIMPWQEIMNLPQDLQIVLTEKDQLLILKKMKYHEDEALKKRIAT